MADAVRVRKAFPRAFPWAFLSPYFHPSCCSGQGQVFARLDSQLAAASFGACAVVIVRSSAICKIKSRRYRYLFLDCNAPQRMDTFELIVRYSAPARRGPL